MKYCVKCGSPITKSKKRYCPYCNADLANPDNVVERDVDISIRTIEEEKSSSYDEIMERNKDILDYEVSEEELKQSQLSSKRKLFAFLFQLFLGCFGAAFFYIKRPIRGILWIVLNVSFCFLSFIIHPAIVIGIMLFVNAVMSIFYLFGTSTDGNGNFLV